MKPVYALAVVVVLGSCFALAQEHGEQSPQQKPAAQDQHGGQQTSPAGQQQAETPAEHLAEAATQAAHGGEAHEEDHHAQFKYSASVQWIASKTGLPLKGAYWLALLFNFAVIAVFAVMIWRSKALTAFRARTAAIQKGIEDARRSSAEANRRLADIESRLARLDTEIASIRAAAEAETAAEEERIRAAIAEESQKIVESAEHEIEAASRQARSELKTYAAELAVSLAKERIQVDAETDRALVGTFLQQLNEPNGANRS